MKEQIARQLTNQPSNSRLEKGGSIFMAENRAEPLKTHVSEVSPKEAHRQSVPKEIPPIAGGAGEISPEQLQRIGKLTEVTRIPDYRSILSRITSTPQDLLRHLFEELRQTRLTQDRQLSDRLEELRPETPQNVQDRRSIIDLLNVVRSEYDSISELLTEIAPSAQELDAATIRRIQAIEVMPEGRERFEAIRELMGRMPSPEDTYLPDEILQLIAKDRIATQWFISELIVTPQVEDEPHQIRSFYGQTNFDKFRRVSRTIMTPDRTKELDDYIAGVKSFHDMNHIIKRSFDQFVSFSQALLPQHFEILSQVPGVAMALRLYEQAYQETLGIETRITEHAFQEIDQRIQEKIRELNDKNTISGLTGQKLEDWERIRAFVLARNFYRISVRIAEQTGLSELPEHGDPKLYTSSAEMQLTQVINALKYLGFRFDIGEMGGGKEWLEEALEESKSDKKKEVGLQTIQGTNVDMREFLQVISARGVFATWRNADAIFKRIRFVENGKTINIVDFFDEHKADIDYLKDLSSEDSKKYAEYKWGEWKKTPEGQQTIQKYEELKQKSAKLKSGEITPQEWAAWKLSPEGREAIRLRTRSASLKGWIKGEYERVFKPLLDNNQIALGLLVSSSFLEVPSQLKELIWERIADLNPLVMTSMLTRLKTSDDRDDNLEKGNLVEYIGAKSLEQILIVAEWCTPDQRNAYARSIEIKGEIKKIEEDNKALFAKDEKLRTNDENDRIKELREELGRLRREHKEQDGHIKALLNNDKWKELTRKLNTAHELRMQYELNRQKDQNIGSFTPKSLEDFLTGDNALTGEETTVLNMIRDNGKKIAHDLAYINQPYAWSLYDTPFEIIDWKNLGQFYNRAVNDLANFQKANGAALVIMENPFGQPIDEILKQFHEIVKGAGDVLGFKSSQSNILPLFRAWLKMVYEGEYVSDKPPENFEEKFKHHWKIKYNWEKFKSFLKRQKILSAAKNALRIPTSRAQEIIGINAPTLDEDGIQEVLDKALPMEILRKEVRDKKTGKKLWDGTYEKLVKVFSTQWFNRLILSKIRDYGPFFLIALILGFFKSVVTEKT